MPSLVVYHISHIDLGEHTRIIPYIPESAAAIEDQTTPRICCALTIPACIQSMELNYELRRGIFKKLYVYQTRVTTDELYQPIYGEVPDAWITGELWIMKPKMFTLTGVYTIKKQQELDGCFYSRYSVVVENAKEVANRNFSTPIYGDISSFSFLDADIERWKDFKNLNQQGQ